MSGHHFQDPCLPFLLQAAIQLSSGHKCVSHFLSRSIPLSTASPHCSPTSAFLPQHILSFGHDPKPQHPVHPFLPLHWHCTPQSSFQSLNTDLACDETDSYYPVLRKTSAKVTWSHPSLSSQQYKAPPLSQLCILAKNYPERCNTFIFPSFSISKKFQACF